jgi:uncharacterized membrane protein
MSLEPPLTASLAVRLHTMPAIAAFALGALLISGVFTFMHRAQHLADHLHATSTAHTSRRA